MLSIYFSSLNRLYKNFSTDYDIVPVSASGEASFRSNATAASFRKPYLRFLAFGEDFHLDLFDNMWLLSPDFKVKHVVRSELKEESYYGKRCHFHGRSINHNNSVAAISICGGIVSKIIRFTYF